jgi:hypothetical protein
MRKSEKKEVGKRGGYEAGWWKMESGSWKNERRTNIEFGFGFMNESEEIGHKVQGARLMLMLSFFNLEP